MGKITESILSVLEEISSTGNFCAKYQLPIDQLEISVKNIGSLQWPLSQEQVDLLLKYASPAHFGRRDKTLLDKDVRHTSELNPDQIEISERSWKEIFQPALKQLKAALGISEESDLTAELHNLLVSYLAAIVMIVLSSGYFFQKIIKQKKYGR